MPKVWVALRRLSTGVWHARGQGPCNWAQWADELEDGDFFPEASQEFRDALRQIWETRCAV